MKTTEMRFWHYTSAFRLPQILACGKIKLDEQARAFGERPAAWISTNPEWEYTVMKTGPDGSIMSKDELDHTLGLARIEIKPSRDFISWYKFRTTSGVNKKLWIEMTNLGREKGANPEEWYASYIPIISRYFLSVEMKIQGKWIKCNNWDKIEQFVTEGMKVNQEFLRAEKNDLLKRAA
jgi:hypothetical protein